MQRWRASITTPTPCGSIDFLNGLGNLRGETFLNLQAARENLDQPRNFAQADDFAIGDVGDVNLAEERQHVVLAEAEHLDVFDDDHFVISDGEESAFEQELRDLRYTPWSDTA